MKRSQGSGLFTRAAGGLLTGALSVLLTGPVPASATQIGQSTLLGDLDYSDSFTVGTGARPDGLYDNNSGGGYNVETTYGGHPAATWLPTANFSFNSSGNAFGGYPGNTGNPGAATGMAQSGGGDYSFSYGVRNHFVVQADATFFTTADRIDIGAYAAAGAGLGSPSSLTVIFRRGPISLYNAGGESGTGFTTGVATNDFTWHNYAVEFDQTGNTISFFVDEMFKGMLNLSLFAGGAYQTYSSAAVGLGGGGMVSWCDNFQVGAPRASVPATLVDVQRTEKMSVAGASAIETLVDAGRVVKQGAGTLSVTNAHLVNGTVEVEAGTLELANGVSDLPSALRAGLVFWVDADRNVEVTGGEVTTWYDVREVSGGTAYPRARKFGSDPAPTWVQGGADVAGHKLVDFGAYGGGQWLQWQSAAGGRWSIANIRTVFMAVSCANGYGYLLGDWDNTNAVPNSGTYDFNIGGNGAYGNPAGVALMDASWWNIAASAYVYQGQTFINGDYVFGGEQRVSTVGEVMSLATTGNTQASNFGNNRNYKASDGVNGVFIDRQGGGRIGEVLIYSSVLTTSQRRMVESYLMKKWLGRGLGTVRVASGATLNISVDGTEDLTSAKVSGTGTLNVQGAGQLLISALTDLALPPIRLGAATVVDQGLLAQRAGQPFVLEGGSVYAVSNGVSSRQALGDAVLIEKTGEGTLTAAAIEAGVRRVAVKAGALRLAPPLPGASGALPDTPGNPSFEVFSTVGTGGDANWGYFPTGTGWTIRGDMSAPTGDLWSGAGLARAAAGTPWCAAQLAPDGDWCMFIKRGGELERAFDVPTSGRYEIAFYTAARPGLSFHLYQVVVDATNIIGSVRTVQTDFARIACMTPPLAAGTHTLCFKGIDDGRDIASVIDAIEISPRGEADYVAVPNSGFEESSSVLSSTGGADSYYFEYNPTNASWAFVGDPAVTNSGITTGNNPWHYTQLENGGQTAFLRQTGELSVPITFPAEGVYCLSFKAAARVGVWGWNRFDWYNGHDFEVKLGGTLVARMTTWGSAFETRSYVLPAIKAGDPLTQTLAFTGLNSNGGDRATLIDDVRVCRMQALANPSFETSATLSNNTWEAGITNAGWEFCIGVEQRDQSGIARSGSDWGNPTPEGACNAFLQMRATIRQTFQFDADGTYTLSFLAAGRGGYLDHDFQVTFDGEKAGYVRTVDGTFRRYSFRLPRVKAGVPYVLAFEGLNHGDDGDRASFLDSVMLTKVDEPAFDASAFAKTELDLSPGTSLVLDYDGVVTMDTVTFNGLTYAGVLSADNTPFIRGTGQIYTAPKGTVLLLQ